MKTTLLHILLASSLQLQAQQVREFFYVEPALKELPVFIRGNLSNRTIILFLQGNYAEKGIDFGRSDYPGWKKTLEQHLAIAYFDKRGLNRSVDRIDTTLISREHGLKDLLAVANTLKQKFNCRILLMGHSAGGAEALDLLATDRLNTEIIEGAIILNAPITTDFSSERYTYYRPLYLKNLAREFINAGEEPIYWKEALVWMTKEDSIHSPEVSRTWNQYVDRAFEGTKRKISPAMIAKVLFSRPYNPFAYLNRKDEKLISDILWMETEQVNRWKTLHQIKQPVLLVTGRFDSIATMEEQQAAHELIQNSKLLILPDCGHESFLDRPDVLNQSIISFALQ